MVESRQYRRARQNPCILRDSLGRSGRFGRAVTAWVLNTESESTDNSDAGHVPTMRLRTKR
jgi:hypothetical protein